MKKVFIGVLAALMLFAFTACENSTPNTPLYGKSVMAVTLTEQPDYIVGYDTIKPEDLNVRVTYNDNSYTDYTGVELKASVSGKLIDNELTAVGITVPGVVVDNTNGVGYSVTVKAYQPDKANITVDVSGAEQKTIALTATEISLKGVTAAVPYGNGSSKTYDVEKVFGEDKITFGGKTVASFGYKAGEEINIIEALEGKANATISGLLDTVTGTWTVKVTEKEIQNVTITQVVTSDTNEIFSGNPLSKVDYKGTITFNDGSTPVEFTKASKTGITVEFTKHQETYPITASGSFAVKVTYTSGDFSDSYETTLPVNVQADYPLTFSAKPKTGLAEGANKYLEGETVNLNNYDFTIDSWASGTTYNDTNKAPFTVSATDFKTPDPIKYGTGVKTSATVDVEYNGSVGVQTVGTASVTYEVVTSR